MNKFNLHVTSNKFQILFLLIFSIVFVQSCGDDDDPTADNSNYMTASFDGRNWEATEVFSGYEQEVIVVYGSATEGNSTETFVITINNFSEGVYQITDEGDSYVSFSSTDGNNVLTNFISISGQISVDEVTDDYISGTFSFLGLDVINFQNEETKQFTNGRFKANLIDIYN